MSNISNKIMAVFVVVLMLAASFVVLIGAPVSESSEETASTEIVSEHVDGSDVILKLSEVETGTHDYKWITITKDDNDVYTFKPSGTTAEIVFNKLIIDKVLTIDSSVASYTLEIPLGVTVTVVADCGIDFLGTGRSTGSTETIYIHGTLTVEEKGYLRFDPGMSKVYIDGTYTTSSLISIAKASARNYTARNYYVYGTFNYLVKNENDYISHIYISEKGTFNTEASAGTVVTKYINLAAGASFTNKLTLLVGGYPESGGFVSGELRIRGTFINEGVVVLGGNAGLIGMDIVEGYLYVYEGGKFVNYGSFLINEPSYNVESGSFKSSCAKIQGTFDNEGYAYIAGSSSVFGQVSQDRFTVFGKGNLTSTGTIVLGPNAKINVGENATFTVECVEGLVPAAIFCLADVYSPDTNEGIHVRDEAKVTLKANVVLDSVKFYFHDANPLYSMILLDGIVSEQIDMSRTADGATVTGKLTDSDMFGAVLFGVDITLTNSLISAPVNAYVVRYDGVIKLNQNLELNSLSVYGDIYTMFKSGTTSDVRIKINASSELYNVPSMSIGDLTYITGVDVTVGANGVTKYDQGIYLRSFSTDGIPTGIKSISVKELWTTDGSVTGEKSYDLTKVKVECEKGWTFEGWYEVKSTVLADGSIEFVYQKVADPSHYTATPGTTLIAMAAPSSPAAPADHDYTAFFITLVVLFVVLLLLIAFVIYKRFFSGQA